jgi:molybdopterin converting factor small subunit
MTMTETIESIKTTVRIPTPLRGYVNNQARVEVHGGTVAEAMSDLTTRYPQLQAQLYDGDTLRSFVNLFVNGRDFRSLGGPAAELTHGDQLAIIPAIAGGQGSGRSRGSGQVSRRNGS